jgi:RpiR family carbohydrate utilization transcriptional regulator
MSIVELARLAREQGAKVIAVTGATNTALTNYSDVLINVETLENTDIFTPTTSRISALVAVDIISTLVARRLDRVENQRLLRKKRYLSQIRKSQIF